MEREREKERERRREGDGQRESERERELESVEGRYKATWDGEFKLPWRKAGPLKSYR
jgi:hypothetical protein